MSELCVGSKQTSTKQKDEVKFLTRVYRCTGVEAASVNIIPWYLILPAQYTFCHSSDMKLVDFVRLFLT